ncbi:MAG: SLC13 family permease [Halofilum sp. (in: g-proteobacteria)]|nr:SLC13 family permease [Halofilum sp. (in: g-proteobacteria)]
MNADQMILLALLGAVLVLLAWGRWRYDVVAFAALLAAVLLGLVPAGESFAGFGHPATVTVALVLIISRAFQVAGTTDLLLKLIEPVARMPRLQTGALSGIGSALSAFMNNVGTLGLLMPVAMQAAQRAKISASTLLMPLSFACILGGLITLIGTPPNIIVAAYRQETLGESFGMFDFSPVGLAVAVVGVVFVTVAAHWLVPVRRTASDDEDLFEIDNYITELEVPEDSEAVDQTPAEIEKAAEEAEIRIVDLVRGDRRLPTVRRGERVRAGDILVVEADPDTLDRFVEQFDLELIDTRGGRKALAEGDDVGLLEAVVTPHSMLEGRTVESLGLPGRHGVHLIAVSRQGKPHHGRLRSFRFHAGDVVLLHGETERLADAAGRFGCLPLRERSIRFGRRIPALLPAGLFAAAIGAAVAGLVSMPVALALAALAMVLTGVLPLREVYAAIDWPVIVLLGALIPVGGALETTGTTDLLVDALSVYTAQWPLMALIALILVVTMTLSDLLNNAATAVIMAPLALAMAERTGGNPDAFLMAVAVGASCAFLTPVGHQNNALVMGPGGYRFGDYWRLGLPLEILIVCVAVPMIAWVWGG